MGWTVDNKAMKTIIHALIFLLSRISDSEKLDWKEENELNYLLEALSKMDKE